MDYSLFRHLSVADGRYPEAGERPLIGLTSNHHGIDADLRERYYLQVAAAGGVPVIIPPVNDMDVVVNTLDSLDGLVLTGGSDHDPRWMGEEAGPLLGKVNEARDLPELLATGIAYRKQLPILGICRGIQTLAVALGGHVVQDISLMEAGGITDATDNSRTEGQTATIAAGGSLPKGQENIVTAGSRDGNMGIVHDQKEDRPVKTHSVRIDKDSTLYRIYSTENLMVNSFHHQAVDKCGPLFRFTAWAEDGVPEAMESTEFKPVMGIQWHPEWLGEDGLPLFKWLVDEARLYRKAKSLHGSILTLDSHCDTPMFFPQGADFSKRDPRILVDLHKMTDGRQDAATMVAYIPQPVAGQSWQDVAPLPSDSPMAYADIIFDRIEAIVRGHPDHLAIARNEAGLLANKAAGRKSIMLGIENALALGDDIGQVEHFARRGAVYFTLCHNGDNQICDSARRSAGTWGGVSPFGEQVIREMNRLGVMVDLSHAGEKSFYDAIAISERPVVCSHSNCKALCDHERNLTDNQLRALAAKDGVCQITLYDGFVAEQPAEADILKAMEHLDYAINIMGIDHVGLGSDFDGDGGIRGLRNSGEMLLFTRQLLLRRYSDEDIRKIWGGNWLRVLATCSQGIRL